MAGAGRRVLVTGAAGFIGRSAIPALIERGFEVDGVSRSGAPAEPIPGVSKWHRADLLEPGAAAELIESAAAGHLMHLAWETTPGAYWTSAANEDWVEASARLLEAFAGATGGRAVVAGSCAEYEWATAELSERSTPIRPATPYGAAKARLFERLGELDALSLGWARLFFSFGPFEHPQRLVPSLCLRLLAGEPAPLTSGEQGRDFLGAAEVGSALAALLDCGVEGAVNIGSGEPVPVGRIAELVGAATGRPELLRVGAIERQQGDPDQIVAEVARLRDEVGWRPAGDLQQAVDAAVSWWRQRPPAG